jgi:hypothetical protein
MNEALRIREARRLMQLLGRHSNLMEGTPESVRLALFEDLLRADAAIILMSGFELCQSLEGFLLTPFNRLRCLLPVAARDCE